MTDTKTRFIVEQIGGMEPLRMYLSFDSDPSTDAVICWHNRHKSRLLDWRVAGESEWQTIAGEQPRVFQELGQRIHNAVLRGLTPSTTYEVRVSGTNTVKRFRTLNPSSPLRVAIASDIHRSDAWTPGSMHQQINARIRELNPDILFALGDYLGGDGAVSEGASEYMRSFCDELSNDFIRPDGTMLHFVTTLGNHDATGGGGGGSFLQPGQSAPCPYLPQLFYPLWRAGANSPTGKGYGSFSVGSELLVIALDSNHSTRLEEQIDWFTETLAARASLFRHVLIASHLPPYPVGADFAPFMAAASGYQNVRFWAAGHSHYQSLSNESGSFPIIGLGGWGTTPSNFPENWIDELDVSYAVARNGIFGSPANPLIPNGTNEDPAPQGFWVIDFNATNAVARNININGLNFSEISRP